MDDATPGSSWSDLAPSGTPQGGGRSIEPWGPDPDDAVLLAAIAAGQNVAAAMALLHVRHSGTIRRVCHNQLRTHRDDVDDAIQDVFVLLQRYADTIAKPHQLRHWLSRTAVNVCRNHRKRACHRREFAVADAPDRPLPVDDFVAALSHADEVERLLARMPAKPAGLLAAHYLRGMTLSEIAHWLGSTPASIKTQMSNARAEARRLVQAGRAMLPLPVLEWIGRFEQFLKHIAPQAVASAVASVVVVAVLVPAFTVPHAGAADVPPMTPPVTIESTAPATALSDTRGMAVPRTVPNTVRQGSSPAGGGGPDGRRTKAYVQPDAAPLHAVKVPVVGAVSTGYDRPTRPPDDQLIVGHERTGEIFRVDARDEPAGSRLFAVTCGATSTTGVVSCGP